MSSEPLREAVARLTALADCAHIDNSCIVQVTDLRAILSLISSRQSGGEWVMVPKEPTEAMVSRGMVDAQLESIDKPFMWSDAVKAAYRAMLAAAPAAPSLPTDPDTQFAENAKCLGGSSRGYPSPPQGSEP